MKQIKNIKDFIATESEDGYIIHLTWDEIIAIETAVAYDAEEREEAYNAGCEFACSPWDKARINLLRKIAETLGEVRK